MADAAGAGVGAFDAYVTVENDSGIPPGISAAAHARQQADDMAAALDRQQAKAETQGREITARLTMLRADLARANLVAESESASEYPQIAAVVAEIVKREAKASAQAYEIEARVHAAREAAAAAEYEATQLEAEALADAGPEEH